MSRRSAPLLLSVLSLFSIFSLAAATALTYIVNPGENACFYAPVTHPGLKISFYFAVQSGGNFEINYAVTDPFNKILLDGESQRQGEFVFVAQAPGDYQFCLTNPSGIFTADHAKMVDFEIAVEKESKVAKLPAKQGSTPEQTSVIEESLIKLSNLMSTVARNQKYFRTRENRNFSTVRSTESRISTFTLVQAGLMAAMALLQVFIVKFFFKGARKGYV